MAVLPRQRGDQRRRRLGQPVAVKVLRPPPHGDEASFLERFRREGIAGANIELPDEIQTAIEWGAEGVGLYRTEFLFDSVFPDEEKQYRTYRNALKELKAEGRVRYIGVTSTSENRYSDLARVMREEPVDFIGVDYAVDNLVSAEAILPLAQELGIAVLGYIPFGRTRLWARVRGREVPEWAAEFGADTWGKFFLKFVIAHPAITCVTPATSKAANMLDNIGAAFGELPDAALQKRMIEYVDALPSA